MRLVSEIKRSTYSEADMVDRTVESYKRDFNKDSERVNIDRFNVTIAVTYLHLVVMKHRQVTSYQ
jgi:hypothetical protein